MRKLLLFGLLLLTIQLSAQVALESSNLPLLLVETFGQEINTEFKIMAQLGAIDNGPGQRNDVNDPFNNYDGLIGIKYRGSSSLSFPKKGYSLETQKPDLSNNNVELLGLPRENDWVLHGPYSDKSLMRNALAYRLAESFMEYAPRTRFCELLINGEYQGVYLLVERIKRDKDRLDIAKLEPGITGGDELTGGYIVKKDKFDDDDRVFTSNYPAQTDAWQQTWYVISYPKPQHINEAQAAYIEQHIHNFEDVLLSAGYRDSLLGYRPWIDVESFIDFLLVQELSRNVDGYRISTYLYKDRDSRDGRLKMGPMWDFNLGFGNVDYCTGAGTEGWAYRFNDFCPEDFWIIDFWWNRLLDDPWFECQLQQRWDELREDQLSDQHLSFMIDSMAGLLDEAQQRNFEQWPVLDEYVWPNPQWGLSYQQELDYLKSWVLARVQWIENELSSIDCPENSDDETPEPGSYFEARVYPTLGTEPVVFEYFVRSNQTVRVRIFNALGQLVDDLLDDDHPPGENSMIWDRQVPQGIYFYYIEIDDTWQRGGKLLRF